MNVRNANKIAKESLQVSFEIIMIYLYVCIVLKKNIQCVCFDSYSYPPHYGGNRIQNYIYTFVHLAVLCV